ncbi:MAG: aminopeptidase [SAR324 cluster bacterium]|uniref:M18 family aminopeptidase n=1 Tax=SAR324 cluster bacterium TaxID=2024889 RepID=A0A2A4T8N2_9DELT|nr:MAG: aminopeptidase [SAR324 cluster bacterium]
MSTNPTELEELGKKLLFEKKCGWQDISQDEEKEIFELSEQYKQFLDTSKTEREAMVTIEKMATAHGYVPIEKASKEDRKLFLNFDDVCGALVYINDPQEFSEGFLMNGAHIDVPRLDLKSFPLYEAEDMAYMKTHYYGGIKKYQWVTRPLAMHGVVITESGKKVDIVIGEDPADPVFTINDLLPHLSKEQNEKPASKLIEGEQLNILVGSIPYQFKPGKNAIKLWILKELHDRYGIVEEDFVSAEIQLVPAGPARDVGFDRSFVGAHGHDDRICSYLGMQALFDIEADKTNKNLMMIFFDKEEIGSMGNSGAQSNLLERMVNATLLHYGFNDHSLLMNSLANSKFLSSDVNVGIDPEWKSVNDPLNAGKMGYGVCLTKYTGVRGKSGSNEAHAEFVAEVRRAFNRDQVLWQTTELGKVDQGGGGTIASYLAYYGMDVVDCGTALLSMHSPFEVASKVDIYHTYKAYKAFYKYL